MWQSRYHIIDSTSTETLASVAEAHTDVDLVIQHPASGQPVQHAHTSPDACHGYCTGIGLVVDNVDAGIGAIHMIAGHRQLHLH